MTGKISGFASSAGRRREQGQVIAMTRTLVGSLCAALTLCSCGSAPAEAQPWEVIVQPGGYKVARGATAGGGLVEGIGLTCERGMAMIALDLPRARGRMPVLLSLSDGRSVGKLGVVRNGATTVWAGPVRDPRVLAMLARAPSVDVAINGMRYGKVSLAGAADAMRGALGGCWRAGVSSAQAISSAPAPAGNLSRGRSDEEFIRNDIATIFGFRDGRRVVARNAEYKQPGVTAKLQALFDACNLAVEKAPPGTGDDEGTYGLTGDQGCREGDLSALDGIGNYTEEEVPFTRTWAPTLKRVDQDTIEADLRIPRKYWAQGFSEMVVYRYKKVGGAWLIDDVGHLSKGDLGWLSESVKSLTAEIQNYSKKKRRR